MCRLALKTADIPFSPYEVLNGMEAMQEGYDGSGLGLLLRGISFEDFKYKKEDEVILSGIAHTEAAARRLQRLMEERGFEQEYDHWFKVNPDLVEADDRFQYIVRVYKNPEGLTRKELEERLMQTRLFLRKNGEEHGNDLTVFSFWSDVVTVKEVGWPLQVGDALGLNDDRIKARVVMAQGRQNTNYGINLYACHPFFIEGVATMTNGENTAFLPIKAYLESRGYPGYIGYESDSEVFSHILHYTIVQLGLNLETYKHVITPLQQDDIANHPNAEFLKNLKQTCRQLIIDGPNCVIGCLPDHSLFMVQDRKKLRPGVVGGKPGVYAYSSEICGLDAAIPRRDKHKDFQPMHLDTAIVGPDRQEARICRQNDPLPLQL